MTAPHGILDELAVFRPACGIREIEPNLPACDSPATHALITHCNTALGCQPCINATVELLRESLVGLRVICNRCASIIADPLDGPAQVIRVVMI